MSTRPVPSAGQAESFAPLLGKKLHTLVLGTMPGQKSLTLRQYYAHPRNALWPILCSISTNEAPCYSIHQTLSYEQRCQLVTDEGFGLWDVLASCVRPGSLDGSIVRTSEIPNPIHTLVAQHPELDRIVCNGRTAQTLFDRHIKPQLKIPLPEIVSVPSTSPAMATLSLEEKYATWSAAICR